MKQTFLGLTLLSAFAAASVNAAPTIGAVGNISFIGSINANSCTVRSSGASNTGANMLVDMGPVSVNSLGNQDTPATSGNNGSTAVAKNIDMEIECVAGTSVKLKLIPSAVSGKGIDVTGGAKNVQIMLVSNQTVLDFSPGFYELAAPYTSGSIPLTAYYTLKPGKTKADVLSGQANATVAYELSYE